MSELMLYDTAVQAIAAARAVDEVLHIRDLAAAQAAYARQVRDRTMLEDAVEIRVRAERRLGELMAAQRDADLLHRGGRPQRSKPPKTGLSGNPVLQPVSLAEAGIDKNLADRARRVAALSHEAFAEQIREARASAGRTGARPLSTQEKRAARAAREAALAQKITALPDRKFGVIYADPEWRFEPYSRETGLDRAADNHYPTSTLELIKARDVPSITANDATLFLWATSPMLPQALEVMRAWGFSYRSQCIWTKDRRGTGYWFRNLHELLLVGTRGSIPAPAPGDNWDSVIGAPVGAHSEKPEIFLDLVESYYPNVPKIELNRRGPPRPGWAAWGNEVTTVDQEDDHGAAAPKR